jgi:hypothetical protein
VAPTDTSGTLSPAAAYSFPTTSGSHDKTVKI